MEEDARAPLSLDCSTFDAEFVASANESLGTRFVLPSAIIFAAWTVSFGCAAHPSQPSRPLGQPFDVKAGMSVVLTDGLKLTFDRVQADSRCPLDAICIQAGEAIVVLTLSQSAATPAERELRTTPAFSEVSYLSFVIKLVALAPYPRSTQQIRPEDYVATLTVERR